MMPVSQASRLISWLILIGSAFAYLILGYAVSRSSFGLLTGFIAGLFLGYAWLIYAEPETTGLQRLLFYSAIVFRLLFLFAVPQLSDDVYRFVWDGRLLSQGFNPYLYLPSSLLQTNIATEAGLDGSLFQHLNSPHYYTVYPPLNQALFGLAAWLSGGNLLWNIVWLRIPIILSEVGTLWLMTKMLRRLNRNPNIALLYGLNPLVILELTGNLHVEAVMVFFVLLAAWLLMPNGQSWVTRNMSAVALALAIATKLIPLLLLPLIMRRLGWKGRVLSDGLVYSALAVGMTLLLFLPFASLELIQDLFSSINLYFQKFEFNASAYYVLREIGYWLRGYNTIGWVGPVLSIITALSILWISFRWQRVSTAAQVVAILTLYWGFATTIHPWYITSLVAATVFTRFRYPIVWSALIPLSYFTYRTTPYHENLWLTALEYGIVAIVAIMEIGLFYPKNDPKSSNSSAF